MYFCALGASNDNYLSTKEKNTNIVSFVNFNPDKDKIRIRRLTVFGRSDARSCINFKRSAFRLSIYLAVKHPILTQFATKVPGIRAELRSLCVWLCYFTSVSKRLPFV